MVRLIEFETLPSILEGDENVDTPPIAVLTGPLMSIIELGRPLPQRHPRAC